MVLNGIVPLRNKARQNRTLSTLQVYCSSMVQCIMLCCVVLCVVSVRGLLHAPPCPAGTQAMHIQCIVCISVLLMQFCCCVGITIFIGVLGLFFVVVVQVLGCVLVRLGEVFWGSLELAHALYPKNTRQIVVLCCKFATHIVCM